MMSNIDVFIKLGENGKVPEYKSKDAAGCDLYATKDFVIRPGETKVMPLDFIIAMDSNIEAQIRPRSGLSLKTTLRMPNSIGTIDSDYRNEVGILLTNEYDIANLPYQIARDVGLLQKLNDDYKEMSLREYLNKTEQEFPFMLTLSTILNSTLYVDKWGNPYGTVYIKKGDRICQMVFNEYKRANFIGSEKVEGIGNDRGGGFGHTDEAKNSNDGANAEEISKDDGNKKEDVEDVEEVEEVALDDTFSHKYAYCLRPRFKTRTKPKARKRIKKSK